MRALFALMLFLPSIAFSEQLSLTAGAPGAETHEVMRKIGAVDITQNLSVVGAEGEHPLHGLYWSVPDFKLVIETSDCVSICYWVDEDFDRSKDHRESSRRFAKTIVFDTEKKSYTVENRSLRKMRR